MDTPPPADGVSQALNPIVSKIREAFAVCGQGFMGLDLPQIVVVGSQSGGKSSVLESIVRQDLLPRGTGIVTRVPLVLQLHCPDEEEQEAAMADPECGERDTWAEFLHIPGLKFFDFDAVKDEINSRTDILAGSDCGVVDAPIYLKVSSPRLMELTLVDLPGITRNPVGDQPQDIEDQIRKLCLKYIEPENSIILAISAANTDISNSDALKLARSVDPQGLRTVGVLTKVDLMDPGTDCLDILENRAMPLKLGYVAVVNRGQKDINENVRVTSALGKERAYFETHGEHTHHSVPPFNVHPLLACSRLQRLLMCPPSSHTVLFPISSCHAEAYAGKAAHLGPCLGTDALVDRLTCTLHACIARSLPDLRGKVKAMLAAAQAERAQLGQPLPQDQQKRVCLDQLSAFSGTVKDELDGNVNLLAALPEGTHQLPQSGAAAITEVFFDIFGASVARIDALDGLSEDYIRAVIANSNSLPPSLFVPEKAFHALVKEQIARLDELGLLTSPDRRQLLGLGITSVY